MIRLRIASSLALGCLVVACSRLAGQRASRARCSSCSPARAARPARPPTSCSASSRKDPSLVPLTPRGRLLGLSRLEGHAGAQAATPTGSAPMPRRAATARSTRRRWWSTASRMCSAATRRRSSAPSQQTRQQAAPLALAGAGVGRRRQADRERAGARTSSTAGEIWLCPITKAVPVTIGTRREPRPHHHLHQRGAALDQARRMDRQGARRFSVPLERFADRRDRLGRRAWCRAAPPARPS